MPFQTDDIAGLQSTVEDAKQQLKAAYSTRQQAYFTGDPDAMANADSLFEAAQRTYDSARSMLSIAESQVNNPSPTTMLPGQTSGTDPDLAAYSVYLQNTTEGALGFSDWLAKGKPASGGTATGTDGGGGAAMVDPYHMPTGAPSGYTFDWVDDNAGGHWSLVKSDTGGAGSTGTSQPYQKDGYWWIDEVTPNGRVTTKLGQVSAPSTGSTYQIPSNGYATEKEAGDALNATGNPRAYTIEVAASADGFYYYLKPTNNPPEAEKINYVGETYNDTEGRGWRWDTYKGYVRDTSLDKQVENTKPSGSEGYGADGYWYYWYHNDQTKDWELKKDPTKYDPARDSGKQVTMIPQPGDAPDDGYGRKKTWNPVHGTWETPANWGVDPATLAPGYIDPAEKARLDLANRQFGYTQQQDAARLASEKEARLANLRANPTSWLEAASLSGQTPVVQPWMVPLMPQQYATGVGQKIPGYNPDINNPNMNLPALDTPSAQYQARISPSSLAQYQGYQQAATGARPEDTKWWLWNQAPPSGNNPGVVYNK